jgi:hypothetical protein
LFLKGDAVCDETAGAGRARVMGWDVWWCPCARVAEGVAWQCGGFFFFLILNFFVNFRWGVGVYCGQRGHGREKNSGAAGGLSGRVATRVNDFVLILPLHHVQAHISVCNLEAAICIPVKEIMKAILLSKLPLPGVGYPMLGINNCWSRNLGSL